MNCFVEGVQGAGKSTLVGRLAGCLPDYRVYREGDFNPVELAWCTYMTEAQYESVLAKYDRLREEIIANTHTEGDRRIVTYTRIITDVPGFHKDLEQYEIYNNRLSRAEFEGIILGRYARWSGDNAVFECSIFQNIVENQILFYEMTDEEIVAFFLRLKAVLAGRDFRILYLEADDIAGSLQVIRKERVDANGNEMWFPLMVGFLEESPHGVRHGLRGFDGLVKHLMHRMAVEKRILREVFPEQAVILKSKQYDLETVLKEMDVMKNLPESIRKLTEDKPYETNDFGKSGSLVRIYDDFVLKIEEERPGIAQMVNVMQWLDGKLPAPKVLATEVKDGYRYLLMSKVRGRMACDEYYMTRPEELVTLLAEALKMLWSVDISDCPKTFDLKAELEEAKYRIEHNLVDLEDTEPETFGEGGFKDPEELLQWLYDHQPEPDPVFAHGDFCLPNVFFEDGKVSGFIDLGDAGIADRWYDIALGYRSLKHNADGTYGKYYEGVKPDELFTKLGIEPDWEKIKYYILLDELF